MAAGEALLRYRLQDVGVDVVLPGARPTGAETSGATVTYAEVYPGVDLRYTVDGDRLKEELVLKTQAAVTALAGAGSLLSFVFELPLNGVTASQEPGGSIRFDDAGNDTRFHMPRPFMEDGSAGGYSTEVQVVLIPPEGGRVRLELQPNLAWLLDPARVYPVLLDPTLVTGRTQPAEASSKDTYVDSSFPTTNYGTSSLLKVAAGGSSTRQTIIQFDDVGGLPQDSIVSSATMGLYRVDNLNSSTMESYAITSAWNEATVTWNSRPPIEASPETSFTPGAGWVQFDLTKRVRKWVQGEATNYGILVKFVANGNLSFKSSNDGVASQRPYLDITYVVATRYGLDRHWSYGGQQDYGGGSSAQVNVSTGNLMYQNTYSSVAARGFDVVLSHTFNSQDAYGSDGETGTTEGKLFGTGFTFSHNIRLQEIAPGNVVLIKDGNGSWRSYVKDQDTGNTRTYTRWAPYDFTLTKDISGTPADPNKIWTMTAEKGLTKYFFAVDPVNTGMGRLTRIEDRNGNYLTYGYDTSSRLTSITDVAGRQVVLEYLGTGGRLSKITDMVGRVAEFGYDSFGNLIGITRKGNPDDPALRPVTTLAQDPDAQLSTITNPNGKTAYIAYAAQGAWDVAGSKDGWDRRTDCGGATTAADQSTEQQFMGAGSLKLTFQAMSCGGAEKVFSPGVSLSATRGHLVGFVYVPSGATPQLTGRLYILNSTGGRADGPGFSLTAGQWNRIYWHDAAVGPETFVIAKLGLELTAPQGQTFTGSVYIDQVVLRGVTSLQTDARPWLGGVIEQHRSRNVITKYTYAPDSKQTTVSRPDENGTFRNGVYTYQRAGWVTRFTDPLSNNTDSVYDAQGRLTSMTLPPAATGHTAPVTTFTYATDKDLLLTRTDPTNAVTRSGWNTSSGDLRYTIDAEQENLRATNQSFVATIFLRDGAGNVTRTETNRYAAGADLDLDPFPTPISTLRTTNFAYYTGAGGLVSTITDPNGKVSSFDYDNGTRNKGYVTRVEEPTFDDGRTRVTTFVRNADGTVQQQTDATSKVTTYQYDGLGRMKQVNHDTNPTCLDAPVTYSELYNYDLNGNRTSLTDGENHQTQYAYDENNRLTTVTDARLKTTQTAYYVSGWRKEVRDPRNLLTSYNYDIMGRLTKTTAPLNRITSYQYDNRGNRKQQVDPNNWTTAYGYSLRDELTSATYSGGPATPAESFQYDRNGNRTQMVDGTGTTTYSYNHAGTNPDDRLNQLMNVTFAGGQSVSYRYDPVGNRTLVSPLVSGQPNRDAGYTYESNNLLKTVTATWLATGDNTVRYLYDQAGRTLNTDYPNYTRNGFEYDGAGRICRLTTQTNGKQLDTGGIDITSHRYSLDKAGNRTRVEDHVRGLPLGGGSGASNYVYDELYRLTSATYPLDQPGAVTAETFNYDDNGNRTSVEVVGGPAPGTSTYSYEANSNQLVSVNSTNYSHDYNGNRTAQGTSTTYGYDIANRQTVATVSGTATTYPYRADGLRHSETRGGNTVTYLWDVGRGIPQVLYDGTNWYLYGQQRIARVNGSGTQFYHHDYPGSVRAISKYNPAPADNVSLVAVYHYEVFGKIRTQEGTAPADNDPLFAGEQHDAQPAEPGNSYLRARYYDPDTGRFTTHDPVPSLNPYTYVGNNPVNRTDPTGLYPCRSPFGCFANESAGAYILSNSNCTDRGTHVDWWTFTWGWVYDNCTGKALDVANILGTTAFTIGSYIFATTTLSEVTIQHEMIHVLQYDLLGNAFLPIYGALQMLPGENPLECWAELGGETGYACW